MKRNPPPARPRSTTARKPRANVASPDVNPQSEAPPDSAAEIRTEPSDPALPRIRSRTRRPISPGRKTLFASIPVLMLFGLALCIELWVRRTKPHVPSLRIFAATLYPEITWEEIGRSVFVGDPDIGWALRPDLREVWWNSTIVSTNAQGMRHPEDLAGKDDGTIRILCLGDSVTFGFGVPPVFAKEDAAVMRDVVRNQPGYPLLLQRMLEEYYPGRRYQVVPMAVPAHTSHQGLAWLRRDIAKLKPDMVTVCYGSNDSHPAPLPDRRTLPTDPLHRAWRHLISNSQAASRFHLWRQGRASAAAPSPSAGSADKPEPAAVTGQRVPVENYVENILEIVRLARSRGARALVLHPVYRDTASDMGVPGHPARVIERGAALREAIRGTDIPWLEIEELTPVASRRNERYFIEAIHPNFNGHMLLARKLFEEIQYLLGDKLTSLPPQAAPQP